MESLGSSRKMEETNVERKKVGIEKKKLKSFQEVELEVNVGKISYTYFW